MSTHRPAPSTRRAFLRAATGTALAAGAAAAWTGTAAAGDAAARGRHIPPNRIGIQLYTVRKMMSESVEDTLRFLSRVGYAEVEFAGLFGHSPADLRDLLRELRLRSPSSHVSIPSREDDLEQLLEQARVLGQRWIVLPYFTAEDLDAYHQLAEHLNWAGEIARRHGIRVGYHNHDHEFAPIGGTRPYDVLLSETDPRLVDFELDIYWALAAGVDPVALFDRAPRRFPLCHAKGMTADGAMTDLGDGVIDYGRVFAEKARSGMQHYFVERDDQPHPRETARDGYCHLRDLTF